MRNSLNSTHLGKTDPESGVQWHMLEWLLYIFWCSLDAKILLRSHESDEPLITLRCVVLFLKVTKVFIRKG